MAEPDIAGLTTDQVCRAYAAMFGKAGDFDRWTLPGPINEELMRVALARRTPVTYDDMNAAHKERYGVALRQPPLAPGQNL